eukprot:CAMPEP_0203745192 /NCGR_PEP_ID=MMETSP0098-20131031/1011_1 /ASSEMBLY_ACC=CAM_ASM_000208 /TAXON_ID=96639 /ORGANISM=" , Strain NY0313808BC1" /LENGTH=1115 /DNA_ID=CAMNT_0050632903 /DNA_START=434 /DNA_END=3781 /DNA_ORIENTATION=+
MKTIKQRDALHLILEFLVAGKHYEAVREVERDTGVSIFGDMGEEINFVRDLILDGDWKSVESGLQLFQENKQLFDANLALYIVRKQKFLEMIDSPDPPSGKVLRYTFKSIKDLGVGSNDEINRFKHALSQMDVRSQLANWTPIRGRYDCFETLLEQCGLYSFAYSLPPSHEQLYRKGRTPRLYAVLHQAEMYRQGEMFGGHEVQGGVNRLDGGIAGHGFTVQPCEYQPTRNGSSFTMRPGAAQDFNKTYSFPHHQARENVELKNNTPGGLAFDILIDKANVAPDSILSPPPKKVMDAARKFSFVDNVTTDEVHIASFPDETKEEYVVQSPKRAADRRSSVAPDAINRANSRHSTWTEDSSPQGRQDARGGRANSRKSISPDRVQRVSDSRQTSWTDSSNMSPPEEYTDVRKVQSRNSVSPDRTVQSRNTIAPERRAQSRNSVSPERRAQSRNSVAPERRAQSRNSVSPERRAQSRNSISPERRTQSRNSVSPERRARSRNSVSPVAAIPSNWTQERVNSQNSKSPEAGVNSAQKHLSRQARTANLSNDDDDPSIERMSEQLENLREYIEMGNNTSIDADRPEPGQPNETLLRKQIEALTAQVIGLKHKLAVEKDVDPPPPQENTTFCSENGDEAFFVDNGRDMEDPFQTSGGDEALPMNIDDQSGDEVHLLKEHQSENGEPARKTKSRAGSSTVGVKPQSPFQDLSNRHEDLQIPVTTPVKSVVRKRRKKLEQQEVSAIHFSSLRSGSGEDCVSQFHPCICLKEDVHPIRAVSFNEDGTRVVVGSNSKCISLVDVPQNIDQLGKQSPALVPKKKLSAGPDRDGRKEANQYYRFGYDCTHTEVPALRLHGVEHTQKNVHLGSVYCLDFKADWVASGSNDKMVKLWELDDDRGMVQVAVFSGHDSTVRNVKFFDYLNGVKIASVGGGNNAVHVWDTDTQMSTALLKGHSGTVFGLDVMEASAKQEIVTSSADGTIKVWDLRSKLGAMSLQAEVHCGVHTVSCSPSNSHVIASGHEDGSCRIWDIRKRQYLFKTHYHTDDVRSIDFSPDGSWLLSASFDGTVGIIDMDAFVQNVAATFDAHENKMLQVKWHPKLPCFVTSSADNTVKLWTCNAGREND